jgi:hypothetical protein
VFIESKLKRTGGTTVTMRDGTTITFRPNETGAHVADVSNRKHIQELLAVSEGFGIYGADDDNDPDQDDNDEQDDDLIENDPNPYANTPAMPLEHMTETDLRAVFEAEIGQPPHHRAGIASMIRAIEAKRAETA